MPWTRWDEIQHRYPQASEPTTWEEDFMFRHRTGGTDRAATMFANKFHPDDQRELPTDFDSTTGIPPERAKR